MENEVKSWAFACYNKDRKIQEESSSGGFFFSIMKNVLEKGGVVFGARFTEKFNVEISYAENIDDARQFMTSKYVQSIVGHAFEDTKRFLEEGRFVLYSGTPCQISGLKNYIKKDYDNLITVEVICHGMPQKSVWERYLYSICGNQAVEKINFRNKNEGVNNVAFSIEFENGKVYRNNLYHDMYIRGFLQNLFLMPSCYDCRYKGMERQADITMGDLWGAENVTTISDKERKGISLVWIHTDSGKKIWDEIEADMVQEEINIDKAIEYNSALLQSPVRSDYSKIFETLINEENTDFNWVLSSCVTASEFGRDTWMEQSGMWQYFNDLRKGRRIEEAAEMALNMKHEVAIVGPWTNRNHGGALTYFALYEAVKSRGYFPLMISQPEESVIKPETKNCGYNEIPYPEYAIAPVAPSIAELRDFNQLCETFIVGSDQWFNRILLNDSCRYMNLRWVYATKGKAAYAASFGYENYDGTEYDRAELANFLQKFDYFSVREKSGVDLVKKNFGIDAECLLDPVFLCERRKFDELADKAVRKPQKEAYIFTYIMDIDGEINDILLESSTILDMSLCSIIDYANNMKSMKSKWMIDTLYQASHEEWLLHIRESSYVITDSFHGMCFAIIFEKPFIAVVNSKRGGTRFETVKELLKLEDCFVYDIKEIPSKLKKGLEINYSIMNRSLEELRSKGMNYLRKILSIKKDKNSALTDFDLLYLMQYVKNRDFNQLHTQNMRNEERINRNEEHINRIDKLFWDDLQQLFLEAKAQRERVEVLVKENAELRKDIEIMSKKIKMLDEIKKDKWGRSYGL